MNNDTQDKTLDQSNIVNTDSNEYRKDQSEPQDWNDQYGIITDSDEDW